MAIEEQIDRFAVVTPEGLRPCPPSKQCRSSRCSRKRSSCAGSARGRADNGKPFVAITRSMHSRFQRSLVELEIRHIRTQIDTPCTNGVDRGPMGDPPGGDPRSAATLRSGGGRSRGHGLRGLPQLPPSPRGAGLADPSRAFRRSALPTAASGARPLSQRCHLPQGDPRCVSTVSSSHGELQLVWSPSYPSPLGGTTHSRCGSFVGRA